MIINSDCDLELHELETVCGGGVHSGSPPTVALDLNNPANWKIKAYVQSIRCLEGRDFCEI